MLAQGVHLQPCAACLQGMTAAGACYISLASTKASQWLLHVEPASNFIVWNEVNVKGAVDQKKNDAQDMHKRKRCRTIQDASAPLGRMALKFAVRRVTATRLKRWWRGSCPRPYSNRSVSPGDELNSYRHTEESKGSLELCHPLGVHWGPYTSWDRNNHPTEASHTIGTRSHLRGAHTVVLRAHQ